MLKLHFWLPERPPPVLHDWDPDAEPGLFQSGVGHGLLELYKRMEARGHSVTIGPDVRDGAHLVCHLESLWRWERMSPDRHRLGALMRALRGHASATCVRGDVPLQFELNV